jgi:hypothetical protein
MTDKVNRYECLIDALYRFACGRWPPGGQAFEWRSEDEIQQALRWIDQLERRHQKEEWEEHQWAEHQRAERQARRRKVKASSVVKLVPPAS